MGSKFKLLIILVAILAVVIPVNAEVRLTSCSIIEKPGYYVLDSDITINKTKCFEIRSSDVVLDGNGHRVEAGRFGGTYAVFVYREAGLGNVTVKNLFLENWVYGVSLRDVAKARVEDVTTEGGFFGVYSSGIADLTIENCRAYNAKKTAFGLEGVKGAELSGLEVKNAGDGILLSHSSGVMVHGSVVEKAKTDFTLRIQQT